MNRLSICLAAAFVTVPVAQAQNVNVSDSTAPWLGYMNVFELDANGGGFVFGSGWGTPDLKATFDDGAGTLTLAPTFVNDPNEFWYQNTSGTAADPINPGGPGQLGNKMMEANLYQEATDVYNGVSLTFSGNVISNSFTAAHESWIFIKDYASDYSSFTETRIAVTAGAFSFSHATDAALGRHVQWGFQTIGENVWDGDEGPFGSAVIGTVPTPASAALLGLGGLIATRRRRA
ncbi:MAG: hypothetical protein ACI89L_002365 [Phycisphaerales bacterium]|jgi:hypothetical protein